MQILTRQASGTARLVFAAGFLLALFAPPAFAQKVVDSFSGETLTLYADAQGTKVVGALKKAAFLPGTPIMEEAGDFGRIETAEGQVWIDMRRVRIKQAVAAGCGPAQKRALVASTGVRGSNDGCK